MYYKDDFSLEHSPDTMQRKKITDGGQAFEIYGPLHDGLFFQDKYLLNNVPLRVKITRNPAAFYILSAAEYDCKVEITEAVLWVRRIQVSPSIELAHSKALLSGNNAVYPIRRAEIEVMSVPAIQQTICRDNLFMSKLPKKLIIGIVQNKNFNGDKLHHPFIFYLFHASHIEVSIDGENVCGTPMSLDFENQKYMRAYDGLFHALNKSYTDCGLDITYRDYRNGFTLFCFDLTADGCGNSGDHLELSRQGNLRFKINLSKPLSQTVSVIVYGEFESILEITNTREVLLDYKK
jgi:hypothetical protein